MKKPWFHILLVVAREAVHGAEIRRRVDEETAGDVTLYPVTLYRSLDELTERGLIEETPHPAAADYNEKRRYYVITARGREALAAEAHALEAAARMAHAVLKEAR
ncbi:MAG TPA: helix-turn-helix transcriptional regulator [Longimicrobiales bacterium]|nr:helix-turn-helix transcriptional regulator [Longimicrobiales bacterium]